MSKIVKRTLLFFIFVILLTAGLFAGFVVKINFFIEFDSFACTKVQAEGVRYFSGKLLGHDVIGITGLHKIPGTRIFDFSGLEADSLEVVKGPVSECLLVFNKAGISAYSERGKELAEEVVSENIISKCISDINNDGLDEIFLLTGSGKDYGDEMVAVSCEGLLLQDGHSGYTGFSEIGRYPFEDLKPWKVQASDVDGDGKKEISVGVYKTAKFHPVMARRPFIYNWNRDGLTPKWLGSRLSRPFDDYIFADIDNDGLDELVAIEYLSDGRQLLNSYKWKGFGFEGIGESESYEAISELQRGRLLEQHGWSVDACVEKADTRQQVSFVYSDGRLVVAE